MSNMARAATITSITTTTRKTANMFPVRPLAGDERMLPLRVVASGHRQEASQARLQREEKRNQRVAGVVANAEAGAANEVVEVAEDITNAVGEVVQGLQWSHRATHFLQMSVGPPSNTNESGSLATNHVLHRRHRRNRFRCDCLGRRVSSDSERWSFSPPRA